MRRRNRLAFSLNILARSRPHVLAVLAVLAASCGNRQPVETVGTDRTLVVEEERRRRTAADWAEIRKAAGTGDARAQCEIGIHFYRRPNGPGSRREGVDWLRKAALQGHAEAMYYLGKAHHDAGGPIKDYRKAVKWFARAAEKGHAPAMVMAGKCHASGGHGLVQDQSVAREWFDRAAEHDDPLALHMLGGAYRWRHEGAGQDWPKAFGCYKRAANLGHRDSQHIVGQFLEAGVGVERDPARAVEWYRRAADQSDGRAQRRLGWCHEHGVGVEKDVAKAIEWYERVAKPGLLEQRIARLKAEREGRAYSPPPPAPQYPVTKEVEVTLVPEKAEYEIGEPAEIAIVYHNVGERTYSLDEIDGGGFSSPFVVRDDEGRILEDPYRALASRAGSWRSTTHTLGPGDKLTQWATLNDGVRFDRPATYTITMRGVVTLLSTRDEKGGYRLTKTGAISLSIRDFDRERRARDIEALVSAYSSKEQLPRGLPFERQLFHVSSELRDSPYNSPERFRIVRLLAFFSEPSLVPFFLDVLERGDTNGYALYGLAGMPDRDAVIEAFKERLEHPEKHNSTKLLRSFTPLLRADPFNLDRGLTDWKAEEELRMKYEENSLALLKGDAEYRYGYLVPGLLGGSEDLFLVDYLLRSKADMKILSRCAHAVGKVKLGREHIPLLEPLLDAEHGWSIADAAIAQLVRLDRGKYLPVLLDDKDREDRRFSPEAHELLEAPPEEE